MLLSDDVEKIKKELEELRFSEETSKLLDEENKKLLIEVKELIKKNKEKFSSLFNQSQSYDIKEGEISLEDLSDKIVELATFYGKYPDKIDEGLDFIIVGYPMSKGDRKLDYNVVKKIYDFYEIHISTLND